MTTNTEITIFNNWPDKALKKMVYVPHHIKAVWMHKQKKASDVDGGVFGKDDIKIRIPYEECAGWIESDSFRELQNVNGMWTIQEGDFFIEGKWDGGNVLGISEVEKATGNDVGKVLNHSENFFGALKHIRIQGGS